MCWSPIPSRRSTRSAARMSTRTWSRRAPPATRATLQVNRRSDQTLLDAYDALFADARLGHEGIVYRRVRAAPRTSTPRLIGAPIAAALRVRVAHRDEPTIEQTALRLRAGRPRRASTSPVTSPRTSSRCSPRARRSSTATPDGAAGRHASRSGRGTSPCSSARTATPTWSATSCAARASRRSSTARAACSRTAAGPRLAAAARGDRAPRLDAPRARRCADAVPRLERGAGRDRRRAGLGGRAPAPAPLGRVLRESGVAALTETIMLGEGLPARMLAAADGRAAADRPAPPRPAPAPGRERRAARRHRAARLACPAGRRGASARTGRRSARRRLESDAEAVQVLTIHRSKGLEFPIVYCPFLWEPGCIPRDAEPVFFHDPAAGDRRTIDVGLDSRGISRACPPASRRAARRGPAPRLCRAHPRQTPGGDLVGGIARTAATRRSAGCCSPRTPTATSRRTALHS